MKKVTLVLALVLVFSACDQQPVSNTEPNGAPNIATSDPGKTTPVSGEGTQHIVQTANPASTNCTEKGGTISIKKNPEGGEYGVCVFEDNRQCEEWALMGNECPVGGVKITGYDNDAQIYCAIRGGSVDMDAKTCTLAGETCNIDTYFKTNKCEEKSIKEMAASHCGDGVSMVYECGDYFGVVSDNMGGGTTYYAKDGTSTTCPVVAPESMSEACKTYMLGSNCAQVNICSVNCSAADKANRACTREYMPVCGNDNKEYSNKCEACASGNIDNYVSGKCKSEEGDIMVGNDRDEHGCIGSAGYTWCEAKGECIRSWETKCSTEMSAQEVFDQFTSDYQVDLGTPTDVKMEWRDAENNVSTIPAKQVSMTAISRDPSIFEEFFTGLGFTQSLPQAADGVGESQAGYTKGKLACLVNIELEDGVYAVKNAKISCGNLE